MPHNIWIISYSFIKVNKLSELFRKIRFPHNFSSSANLATIEFKFRHFLLQKFIQAYIIFIHQHTVSAIKVSKRLTTFMIMIALPKELGSYGFVTIIEVTYVRRCSNETNKLRYVHEVLRVTSPSKNGKLTISKSSRL